MKKSAPSATVDAYIKQYPPKVQRLLKRMRTTIRKAAPEATETISYKIPSYRMKGFLVHFAAFSNHIGFFPTSAGVRAFKKELGDRAVSSGTVRFPLDRPIPYSLVARIVRFRVRQQQTTPRRRRASRL